MQIEFEERIDAHWRVHRGWLFVWSAHVTQDSRVDTTGKACDLRAVRVGAYPVVSYGLVRFQLYDDKRSVLDPVDIINYTHNEGVTLSCKYLKRINCESFCVLPISLYN